MLNIRQSNTLQAEHVRIAHKCISTVGWGLCSLVIIGLAIFLPIGGVAQVLGKL